MGLSPASGRLHARRRPRGGWWCRRASTSRSSPPSRWCGSRSRPRFDERGRLWVIEYLQYPNPAGLKPVTVDQYLRTEYDRVPEPPPRGPRGADRIKILEDTDGDGRADKTTVFVEGLNLASGAGRRARRRLRRPGALPALLSRQEPRRPARRRPRGPAHRLRPAGRPRDGQLADLGARRLALRRPGQHRHGADPRDRVPAGHLAIPSPDHGSSSSSPRAAATPGASTSTRTGNAFGSSNGGYITFHMVQGGYYVKGFAKHGPLHNPAHLRLLRPDRLPGHQAGRPRHAGRDHLPGRRLSAGVPRRVHRRQPALERGLLARAQARRARPSPAGTAAP